MKGKDFEIRTLTFARKGNGLEIETLPFIKKGHDLGTISHQFADVSTDMVMNAARTPVCQSAYRTFSTLFTADHTIMISPSLFLASSSIFVM
jgi:hypothetical protein